MSKDHTPHDFGRSSGYKSDLELAESSRDAVRINTSFGGKQHNSYIMNKNGTHEHFFYNPSQMRNGWHGANYETKHNKPNRQLNLQDKAEKNNKSDNSFLDSVKAEKAALSKSGDTSNNAKSLGSEKSGYAKGSISSGHESGGKSGGQGSAGGQGSGGHGASGGQGTGGQGSGGQGSGGQGGSGGGHGGGGQGGGNGGH